MRFFVIFLLLITFNNKVSNNRVSFTKRPNIESKTSEVSTVKSILVIGDSQSTITTQSGQRIYWTWPTVLEKKLKNCGTVIDVVAMGGKTSKWMLQNGRKKLLTGKWDRVIIYGGGNDATNMSIPLDTTISNFQRLIDLAKNNGSDVWVNLGWKIEGRFMDINILPVGRPSNLLNKKSDWLPYVEKRKQLHILLKERLTGCKFIEPYDLNSMTSDGIHPTAKGHILVADYILKTIDTTECQ